MRKIFFILTLIFFILLPGMVMASICQTPVVPKNDGYNAYSWQFGGYNSYCSRRFNSNNDILTAYLPVWNKYYNKRWFTFDNSSLSSIGANGITRSSINLEITSAYNSYKGIDAEKLIYASLFQCLLGTAAKQSPGGSFAGLHRSSPVPIPSSILLFGSGLVGLVGIGRRRRKK